MNCPHNLPAALCSECADHWPPGEMACAPEGEEEAPLMIHPPPEVPIWPAVVRGIVAAVVIVIAFAAIKGLLG